MQNIYFHPQKNFENKKNKIKKNVGGGGFRILVGSEGRQDRILHVIFFYIFADYRIYCICKWSGCMFELHLIIHMYTEYNSISKNCD